MKKILILFFALSLTACASIPNPFKTNNLYEIEAAVGVARISVLGYFSLRQCKKSEIVTTTNVCARRSVKVQLQIADRNLQFALIEARQFIKNNPTIDPSEAFKAVRGALSLFQSIALNNGIRIN